MVKSVIFQYVNPYFYWMNSRYSALLIILMSLSLAGIVCIQGYLINNAVKSQNRQFFSNAKSSMRRTAGIVREREFAYYFHPLKKSIDSLNKRAWNQTSADLIENFQKVNSEEDVKKYRNKYDREIKKVLDKIAKSLYEDTLYFQKSVNIKDEISDLSSLGKYEYFLYESVIKDYTDDIPISKRIESNQLEALLSKELKKRGINIDFEFGVFNKGSETTLKSKGFDINPERNWFATSIFEYARRQSNYKLIVSFPGKNTFLWSSIAIMVTLSSLLLFVIMATYYYAYKKILELRKISEIKTDFINNTAHELKTPIATINLALDFIKNPKVAENKVMFSKYLSMIRFENKRIFDQVQNLLEVAKLERKVLNIEKQSEDIHPIIEEAVQHLKLITEESGGQINLHLKAEQSKILANKNYFINLIINILDNSIKYTKSTPIIDVYTENAKKCVILTIKDQGIGISKEDLAKVFDKFYRVPKGNVHDVKGHGLGLSYVKHIVDDHQAEIFVKSNKGEGTTFIIEVPLIS